MNDRKTEIERITKEQLTLIERSMAANKVKLTLQFDFDIAKGVEEVLKDKGYTVVKNPKGFKVIIKEGV